MGRKKKKTKKIDDENFAAIMGAFIAVAAALIGFMRGLSVNTSFMVFILVFIFGTVFILLANVAYLDLKDWNKNKGKKQK